MPVASIFSLGQTPKITNINYFSAEKYKNQKQTHTQAHYIQNKQKTKFTIKS